MTKTLTTFGLEKKELEEYNNIRKKEGVTWAYIVRRGIETLKKERKQ